MKVILNQDINDLGKKYDIRNVSDGYARNFLMPRKLAKPATEQTLRNLARQKAEWEKKEKEIRKQLEAKAEELKGQKFEFTLKLGEKREVFGSIDKKAISKALEEKGFRDVQVLLDKPIKKLGEEEVEVDFGKGIKAKIRLSISH